MGIVLNKDISCVGFDRLNELEMMGVTFNYIDRNTEKMGRNAIDCLIERLKQPDIAYSDHVIKPELVLRSL